MGKREIYFGIGDATGMHSSVWKVWVQGDEMYAAQVSGYKPVVKLSVHKSGVCRLANVESATMDISWDQDRDPRVSKRWLIPPVGGGGDWVGCFALRVPNLPVVRRFALAEVVAESKQSRVVLIKPAPPRCAVVIMFVRTPSAEGEVPTLSAQPQSVIGFLDLRSGPRIWILRTVQALSAEELATWRRHFASVRVSGPEPGEAVFGVLMLPTTHAFPAISEVALGRENFVGQGVEPFNTKRVDL